MYVNLGLISLKYVITSEIGALVPHKEVQKAFFFFEKWKIHNIFQYYEVTKVQQWGKNWVKNVKLLFFNIMRSLNPRNFAWFITLKSRWSISINLYCLRNWSFRVLKRSKNVQKRSKNWYKTWQSEFFNMSLKPWNYGIL